MFARHASGPQEDSDPEDDGDFERDNDDDDFNEIDTPSPALCPTLRSPPRARPKPIILSLARERWHPAPTLPTSPVLSQSKPNREKKKKSTRRKAREIKREAASLRQ
jgi:hypothetical protein